MIDRIVDRAVTAIVLIGLANAAVVVGLVLWLWFLDLIGRL